MAVSIERENWPGDKRFRKVLDFLRSESTLTLCSIDPAQTPHAASLFYMVSPTLDLYWISSTDSLHSIQISTAPEAAVSVFRSTFDWREIAGVQMHGRTAIIEGKERDSVLDAYCERFHLGRILGLAVRKSTLYSFHPRWVRYTDNRTRLARKFEFTLD
jgi:uncharacterized protein YhbP (UPF0306 family)